jgi:hypothetical protein
MVNLFQILNQFVLLFRKNVIERSSMIWRVLPLVRINTLYKAKSKFENEPKFFFKAVSLDHQRVSPIVESLLVFPPSLVCSQISIR